MRNQSIDLDDQDTMRFSCPVNFVTGQRLAFGCQGFLISKVLARLRGLVNGAKRPELVQLNPISMILFDLADLDLLAERIMLDEDVPVVAGPMPNITYPRAFSWV